MDRFDMQCSTVAFETKKSPTGQMLKSCVPKGDPFDQEVTALFEEMIEEYLDGDIEEQSLDAPAPFVGRSYGHRLSYSFDHDASVLWEPWIFDIRALLLSKKVNFFL